MAQFTREGAKIQEVYVRRVLPGGQQKYLRLPFNLIEYDDASGVYVEPIPTTGLVPWTFGDVNTAATDGDFLILDKQPFDGITEIR
jgi:hypothetical protein